MAVPAPPPTPVSIPMPAGSLPLRRSARLELVVHPAYSPPPVGNRKRARGVVEPTSHLPPAQQANSPKELRADKRRRVEAPSLPTRKRKQSEPSVATLSHTDEREREASIPKRRKENGCAVALKKTKPKPKPPPTTTECSKRSVRSRRSSSLVAASQPRTRTRRSSTPIPVIPVTIARTKEKLPSTTMTSGAHPEKAACQRRSARVSGRSARLGSSRPPPIPSSHDSTPRRSSMDSAKPSHLPPGRGVSPAPEPAHITPVAMAPVPEAQAEEDQSTSPGIETASCESTPAHIVTPVSKDDTPDPPSSPTATEPIPDSPPSGSAATTSIGPPISEASPEIAAPAPSIPNSALVSMPSSDRFDVPKLLVIPPTPPSSSSSSPSSSPPPDNLPFQIYEGMGIKVIVTPPSREASPPPPADFSQVATPPPPSLPFEGLPPVVNISEYVAVTSPVPLPMDVDSSGTQPAMESMGYMQYDHQQDVMMGMPGPGPSTTMWRQQQQQGFGLHHQQQDQPGPSRHEESIQLQQPYTYSYGYDYANGLSFSSEGGSPPQQQQQQPYVISLEQGQDVQMEDGAEGTGCEYGEEDGTARRRRWVGGRRRTPGMWEIACQFRVAELIRRYTFPAIRDIVAHQMETYSMRHGRPKSWYLLHEAPAGGDDDGVEDTAMGEKVESGKENENVNESGCGGRGAKVAEDREDWSDYESELSDSDDEGDPESKRERKRRRSWLDEDEDDDEDEEDDDEDAEGEIDPDAWHDPSFQVQQQGVQGGGRMGAFYVGPVGCVGGDGGDMVLPRATTAVLEQSAMHSAPAQPAVQAQTQNEPAHLCSLSQLQPQVSTCPSPLGREQSFGAQPTTVQPSPSPLLSLSPCPSPSPSHCLSPSPFSTSAPVVYESTLPVPPPRLSTIRALSLRAIEVGVARAVVCRGTPVDRARAEQWARGGAAVAGRQLFFRGGGEREPEVRQEPGEWEQRGRRMERGRGRGSVGPGMRSNDVPVPAAVPMPEPGDGGFNSDLAEWDAFLDRLEREEVGDMDVEEGQQALGTASGGSDVTPMEVDFDLATGGGPSEAPTRFYHPEQRVNVTPSPASPSLSLASRPPPNACWWLPGWVPQAAQQLLLADDSGQAQH